MKTCDYRILRDLSLAGRLMVGVHGVERVKWVVLNIAGSSNGRTHPSGGCYSGSNPGPAANQTPERGCLICCGKKVLGSTFALDSNGGIRNFQQKILWAGAQPKISDEKF